MAEWVRGLTLPAADTCVCDAGVGVCDLHILLRASSLLTLHLTTKSASARQGRAHPILANLVTSGTAVGLATACTQPMDVLKVRMQLEALVKGHQAVGMVRL